MAAKKFLKYLTSLCDAVAADPECGKSVEELASEVFDLKGISDNGIFVAKHMANLPTLSFGSNEEGCFVQRDGKSEPESQPLILLPIVPTENAPEEMTGRNFSENKFQLLNVMRFVLFRG